MKGEGQFLPQLKQWVSLPDNHMKTNFVSIDSSTTSSGICLWVNGVLAHYRVLQPKDKTLSTEDRMAAMAGLIANTLNEWKPTIIFAETPQGHGANVKLARQLGEILGVILGWAASHNCSFTEVNPSWWRKWNPDFHQGKLDRPELKKESLRYVQEHFGIDCKGCDDLSDAILIGNGALHYFESLEDKENLIS